MSDLSTLLNTFQYLPCAPASHSHDSRMLFSTSLLREERKSSQPKLKVFSFTSNSQWNEDISSKGRRQGTYQFLNRQHQHTLELQYQHGVQLPPELRPRATCIYPLELLTNGEDVQRVPSWEATCLPFRLHPIITAQPRSTKGTGGG